MASHVNVNLLVRRRIHKKDVPVLPRRTTIAEVDKSRLGCAARRYHVCNAITAWAWQDCGSHMNGSGL
jgi:hypothetical protein